MQGQLHHTLPFQINRSGQILEQKQKTIIRHAQSHATEKQTSELSILATKSSDYYSCKPNYQGPHLHPHTPNRNMRRQSNKLPPKISNSPQANARGVKGDESKSDTLELLKKITDEIKKQISE